jgi:hypothetical protein
MLKPCFVTVVDNPSARGGVFLLVISKDEPHRCWYQWFESAPIAGSGAHALGLAARDEEVDTRYSKLVRYKIFPQSNVDLDKLDAEWEKGRPPELYKLKLD